MQNFIYQGFSCFACENFLVRMNQRVNRKKGEERILCLVSEPNLDKSRLIRTAPRQGKCLNLF